MDKRKEARLKKAGWKVGDAKDLLTLTDEDAAIIDTRIALAKHVRATRTKLKLSQQKLAARIGSSQSRVAKMEAADPSVSIDLLLKCAFAMGSTQRDIGRVLARKSVA